MKADFKSSWNSSTQKRKQRKYVANAPKHVVSKLLHANLSKSLREKHKKRSVRVRQGDEVEVLRGSFKQTKGVVDKVNTKTKKLTVRGVEHVKLDGSKSPYPVSVSNVRLTKLVDDSRRFGGKQDA